MNQTPHDDILELIPAYVLGSLDPKEADRVTSHLRACAPCRAQLEAYEAVAAMLPLAGPQLTPSAGLKSRLMEQVRVSGQQKASAASPARPWWRRLQQNWPAHPRWQPVAALLVLLLLLGNVLLWQRAVRSPDLPGETIRLTGSEAAPAAQGTIVVSENGRNATLIVESLPPLDPDRQYQLWLIDEGNRASGGVFSVNADGYASLTLSAPRPFQEYTAFGVTVEPAGGSPGPTGERVLGHNL